MNLRRTVELATSARGLAVALALGLALRVALTAVSVDLSEPELWEFDDIARHVVDTGTFAWRQPGVPTAYMPPAYPLLLAGLYRTLGDGPLAHGVLAALSIGSSLLTCGLIAGLAYRLHGRRAGAVALLLALFWPRLLMTSGRLHDLPIYASMLALYAAVLLAPAPPRRRAVAAGVALGLFGAFRFDAAAFLLPGVGVFLHRDADARRSDGPRWQPAVLLVAVFLALQTPWLVRNYLRFDTPVLGTSGGYALRRGHHPGATGTGREPWPAARDRPHVAARVPEEEELARLRFDEPADELAMDRMLRRAALEYVRREPGATVVLAARKAGYFLVADFTHPYDRHPAAWLPSLVALGVAGLFVVRGRWPVRTGPALLVQLFLLQLVLAVGTFVLPRYRMLVEFVPLVLVSAPIAEAIDRRVGAAPER